MDKKKGISRKKSRGIINPSERIILQLNLIKKTINLKLMKLMSFLPFNFLVTITIFLIFEIFIIIHLFKSRFMPHSFLLK